MKRVWIGKSAAEQLRNKLKVQRLEYGFLTSKVEESKTPREREVR